MSAEYKTLLKTPTGETIAELPDASAMTHAWYLNASGSASFNLPKRTPSIPMDGITLAYTTMHTYRNGTLLWAGEIQTKSGARADSVVQYGAKDWFELLSGVNIDSLGFADTDPSEIIEALLDYHISKPDSDTGIRLGTTELSQTRDRTFIDMDIKRAIYELTASSTVNGVDIEVTADKLLNVFARKGTQLDSVSFELGRNMLDYWITEDASALATEIRMLGAGDGSAMLVAHSQSSAETLQNFRRRTTVLSKKDITQYATLFGHAAQENQQRQVPRQIVTIHVDAQLDPGWGAYAVGDTVRIKIDDGLNQIDGWFRIYGLELQRSALGMERAKIITNPL